MNSDNSLLVDVDDSDVDVCVVDEDEPVPLKPQGSHQSRKRSQDDGGDNVDKQHLGPKLSSALQLHVDEVHLHNSRPGGSVEATDGTEELEEEGISKHSSSPQSIKWKEEELPEKNLCLAANHPVANGRDDSSMMMMMGGRSATSPSLYTRSNENILSVAEDINANAQVNKGIKMQRKESITGLHNDDYDMTASCASANSDDRFYFESDHLAFKHNKDYKVLLKTLVVLEAQRIQAVKDLQVLHKWKERSLEDPIAFVESLQSKDPPELPKRQSIAALPQIDWTHYLTTSGLSKIPQGYFASTRRSFRTKGDLQGTDSRVKSNLLFQEDNESVSSEGSQDQSSLKLVRGRQVDDANPLSFNRLWTTEEQERLEKLLQVYPPEDVEARRWEKIAKALGNRTPKQLFESIDLSALLSVVLRISAVVSSRVQKYFIKLARAGLPIPGRAPHMSNHKKSKINPVSYRNSTFFPSWKPSVYMNEDEEDACSITTIRSDDTPCVSVSDEEMIPEDLKDTAEYKELLSLMRVKKQLEEARHLPFHHGYGCDGCGVDPIKGTRWHCSDCVGDVSFDVCDSCFERNKDGFNKHHPSWHRMISIKDSFMDDDYLAFELQEGKYNYLDPNFIPKTR
eukprot:gene5054-5712_t